MSFLEKGEIVPVVNEKKHIGGWLLFFIISITILSPLMNIFTLISTLYQIIPIAGQYPGLLTISVIDAILSLGLTVLGIYAGIKLWAVKPRAVKTAKMFLYAYLIYSVIACLLPYMIGLSSEATQAMVGTVLYSLFKGLLFSVIWLIYLNKSHRVYNTYS